MQTVLIIEDQFLPSYDLECALKERGYDVQQTASASDGLKQFRLLKDDGRLCAVVCDNRLIDGEPAAAELYQAFRQIDRTMPIIVYSGFPPGQLPRIDEYLAVVRKPFIDQVVTRITALTQVPKAS